MRITPNKLVITIIFNYFDCRQSMMRLSSMKNFFVGVALIIAVSSVRAGCENYEDLPINQRPMYLFCISRDNCSLNFLRASCANVYEQFYDFGGLLLQEELKDGKLVRKQALFMEKPIAKNWNLYSCLDEPQKCLKFQ